MWIVGVLFVACFILPIALPFAAALWETRLVWPYVPAQPAEAVAGPFIVGSSSPVKAPFEDDGPVPATAHIAGCNQIAYTRGFRPIGVMRSGNGKLYRIRYDFWLSPD